jgi:hypothetical protein
MITRIVKLHFKEDRITEFLEFFETIKHKVNGFPGCLGMRLIQDIHNPNVIMTYSDWESEIDLNKYRDSETFGMVWPKIKPWFAEKPEAWTSQVVFDGFLK